MQRELLDRDRALVLRLTLLMVILYGPGYWSSQLPASLVSAAMITRSEWLPSRFGWVLLFALLIQGVALQWYRADNHQYLIAYWVLAINISFYVRDPEVSLRAMARGLISGTFLFATLWKIRGGEFFNGVFWEGMLLTDRRLAFAAEFLGGLGRLSVEQNHLDLGAFLDPVQTVPTISLTSTPRLERLAYWLGWGGVILEALIALLFILPSRMIRDDTRVIAILIFIFGVYMWLPVPGFGWVLGIMTLAYLPPHRRRLREFVFCALLGLILVTAPKQELFSFLLRRGQ